MTQRFYFELTNGLVIISDYIGVEADDLDQAIKEARVVIKEMRDRAELSEVDDGWMKIIRDEEGEALMTQKLVSRVTTAEMSS